MHSSLIWRKATVVEMCIRDRVHGVQLRPDGDSCGRAGGDDHGVGDADGVRDAGGDHGCTHAVQHHDHAGAPARHAVDDPDDTDDAGADPNACLLYTSRCV